MNGKINFSHGFPHFAISIAVEYNNEIVTSVIIDPLRDEIYFAEKGKGSFLNDRRIRVSKRNTLNSCIFSIYNDISSNSNLSTSRINLDSEYAPIQSSSNLQNSNRAIWTIQLDADPTTIGTSLAGVIWTGTEFWCAKWNSADIYTADASGNLTGNFNFLTKSFN